MVGRLLRTADFERVLSRPPCSRSAHFAVHHLPGSPSLARAKPCAPFADKLSTGDAPLCAPAVDDSLNEPRQAAASLGSGSGGCWLGTVVPKRHARRAATRNLLKRQMRAVMQAQLPALASGLWVVRLKAPFDQRQFPSAASAPLRASAREELSVVLQRAARSMPAEAR